MSISFQYQGRIADTSFPEMLANINRHRVPGRIEMAHHDVVKKIFISDGNVIHARSTDRSDRLGAHLYRIGKLTRDELVETMRERETSGKLYGQLLIERNLLSPTDLYDSIRGQMESIVWSVFSWQEGEVIFQIGEFKDPVGVKIHLPMRQVIVRGIKQAPDPKALVARLGRKKTVFVPTYTTEDLIQIALDSEEYTLLRLVDGRKTLYQVCTDGPYSVSENARLLYAFHVLHLIERADGEDHGSGGVKIRLKT